MAQRVLLIGDSIRMAYAPFVREAMSGDAEIIDFSDNGGDSANVRAKLDTWLAAAGGDSLDAVHFNCGLHDIKRAFDSEERQVPLDQYEANLREIVARLKALPKARVVWATITPVSYARHHATKGFDRFEIDVDAYNAAALSVMQANGLPVNDLHAVIQNAGVEDCLVSDGVHMNDTGNALLAEEVVRCLRGILA